jgi:hypothetical protein
MEALILLADMAVMTYLCWRVFKAGTGNNKPDDLGLLSYRKDKDGRS